MDFTGKIHRFSVEERWTDRRVKSWRIQQTGHFVLREEHGVGIQTSHVQLLRHQIPECLEKICEKEPVFTRLKEKSAKSVVGENATDCGDIHWLPKSSLTLVGSWAIPSSLSCWRSLPDSCFLSKWKRFNLLKAPNSRYFHGRVFILWSSEL